MATKTDLMGLGTPAPLANRLGTTPTAVTAYGASRASAYAVGGSQFLIAVVGTATGAGLTLPAIGGDNGALLGDDFVIANINADIVTVYANTSNTSIAASASNNSLITIAPYTSVALYPITTTSWLGIKGA